VALEPRSYLLRSPLKHPAGVTGPCFSILPVTLTTTVTMRREAG